MNYDTTEMIQLSKSMTDMAAAGLPDALKQGAFIAGTEVQSEARANVAVDTGQLRLSIENGVSMVSGEITATVGPTKSYGREIEMGRPPGTFVSATQLAGWAKRKGLNPHLVSFKIFSKGSPPQPFLFPAFNKKKADIISIIGQAVQNAIKKAFA